jgi:hypothetical protein
MTAWPGYDGVEAQRKLVTEILLVDMEILSRIRRGSRTGRSLRPPILKALIAIAFLMPGSPDVGQNPKTPYFALPDL